MGFLDYDAESDAYEFSPEASAALADEASPMFVAGAMVAFRAIVIGTEKLIDTFKGDGGVPWGGHHPNLFRMREFFRPAYQKHLVQEWIPALDGIVSKL